MPITLRAIAVLLLLAPSGAIADSTINADKILILFNHGSSQDEPGDCKRSHRPRWVKELHGDTIAGKTVRVEYPCTDGVTEDYDEDGGWCELRVCKRATKIAKVIEDKVAEGFQRQHIFLAGQSAGGWASILIKRHDPGKVNGVIVTAPAFGGQREGRFCESNPCAPYEFGRTKRQQMRLTHEAHLRSDALGQAPVLDALVFGFECDRFGFPAELPFEANSTVILHTYPTGVTAAPACAKPIQRWYAGQRRDICDKVTIGEGRDGYRTPQACSRKRVAYCPKDLVPVCRTDTHKKLHATRWFRNWVQGERYIEDFIEQRIKAWHPPSGGIRDGTPCDFIRLPPHCIQQSLP